MRHFFSSAFLSILLFTLLTLAGNAQTVPRPEADSLLRLLQDSQTDTNRVNQLIRLGEYHVYKPGEFKADMDSARDYALQAKALSRHLRYYQGEGRSLNLLGTISREAKELEQSIAYHQSAIRLYQQHQNWQEEAASYLLLSWAKRDKGDAGQARQEVQKAISLYTKNGYREEAAQAYIELGNTYANWGEERKERIRHYEHALQQYTQTGNKKRQADLLKELGDLYYDDDFAQALLAVHKALALYQSIGYPLLQSVYDMIGAHYTYIGDYQNGIKYGLLAIKTAEAVKDTTLQLCTIYNRVGLTYFNMGDYQKASDYFKKSLRIAEHYRDLASITVVSSNLFDALLELGQPEEALRLIQHSARQFPPQSPRDRAYLIKDLLKAYTLLKQYPVAQQYYDQFLVVAETLGKENVWFVYRNVINFLIASGQYKLAHKHLSEFELISLKKKYPKGVARAQLLWFRLDSLQGNYQAAIGHYQRFKYIEDSVLNETKRLQVASLEVLYETKRKEKDLQLKEQNIKALTQERQLQAKQIEQDLLVRNVIIGGAILLLLLLGITYNRYSLKKRNNSQLQAQQYKLQAQHEELQTQQEVINDKNEQLQRVVADKDSLLFQQKRLLEEKERLLKEIHHRVKNNLQIVMSLLNSQAASLKDLSALSAIQESQHRVQAMALIHQKLYQAEGIARIPMKAYIEEVVAYLQDSYNLNYNVNFALQVEDIELDVTQAVPLGLIINEAVTNAFKYAFPDGRSGKISVQLHRKAEYNYQLSIADNGVGLPQDFDPSSSRSLGMTLLHGFSAQLEGELNITSDQGLTILLAFAEDQLSSIPDKVEYASYS